MRVSANWRSLLSAFLLLPFVLSLADAAPRPDQQPLLEALAWVRNTPRTFTQYDYIMTVRVHLLFFWTGKDDVGSGYIRRGVSSEDSHREFFQVLFGSDPQKAPRAINRWGAGTEVALHKNDVTLQPREVDITTSAFVGFMKSSRGKSVSEMQAELVKENEKGEHSFTGILSRVEPSSAISMIVPLLSQTDNNLHQCDLAEPLMLDRISASDGPIKTLDDASRCPRANGFMATVADLMDSALQGQREVLPRCYVHDAQENTLTLDKV